MTAPSPGPVPGSAPGPTPGPAPAAGLCARLGLGLAAAIGLGILGYFAIAGVAPGLLARPLFAGGTMTLWFPIGWALIAGAVGAAAVYVRRANRAEDALRAAGRGLPALLALLVLAKPAAAATGAGPNLPAIGLFLILVAGTLAITWWAARRTRSAAQFYAGDGQLTALQNGLAIAGDTLSAGAFLGLSGLVFGSGFDGLVYAVGYSVGYPIIALLFADRMRRLGRFTFADVLCYRLGEAPVRSFAIASTLTIVIFYLIAQMVGAGQLIQLLFGLDYVWAEAIVGGLMICYVIFGGMTATSWVQIVKAVLMLFAGIAIALLALGRFGFDFGALLGEAVRLHPKHEAILAPTGFALMPVSALSLAVAQLCGSAGLPHVIMRFFTVPDARTARVSMLWGSVFIGLFFALVFVIGFATIALVRGNPAYLDASGALIGGGNMAAVHLAHAVGGDLMLGFVAAVAFATILAVVAGLTLSGASAISHDLYASLLRRGRPVERTEVLVSRLAVLVLGLLAVGLGIAFRQQNVAYMIALVVGIAASSNFPLLLLAIYWRGLTTAGAVAGGLVGLASAILLTVIGPSVWVKVLGHAAPLFPLDPPTLVTMPLAFLTCVAVSLLDRSRRAAQDRAGFAAQSQRMAGLAPAAAE
ncbi:sodium:solute symporter family transporter [Roseicella frigidaeris]|nr:sodium/solute symporter [Roseicella frigidaeris]